MNLLRFQHAAPDDMPTVYALYKAADYGGKFSPSDKTFIAKEDNEIIGVVRLADEHSTFVLRGMQIRPDKRGQGIGQQLLNYFISEIGNQPCYCIAYRHLIRFYASVGFSTINQEDAPDFLGARITEYIGRKNGKDYILMFKPGNT